MNPRKHSPKIQSKAKFAFVSFETTDAALNALKKNFNKNIQGEDGMYSIVIRFRRVGHHVPVGVKKPTVEEGEVEYKEIVQSKPKQKFSKVESALEATVKSEDSKSGKSKKLEKQSNVKSIQNEVAAKLQKLKGDPNIASEEDDHSEMSADSGVSVSLTILVFKFKNLSCFVMNFCDQTSNFTCTFLQEDDDEIVGDSGTDEESD